MLVESAGGRPAQMPLRRAVSTAYYAVFHALARSCADMLIGGTRARRSEHAWLEVYRSLAHGTAKAACDHKAMVARFPPEISEFASVFAEMQEKREKADYDPLETFYKSEVVNDISRSEFAIGNFLASRTRDRRAFASWVLFRNISRKPRN